MEVKDPVIINDLFSQEEHYELSNYLKNKTKRPEDYSSIFGRYCFNDSLVDSYAEKLIPIARKHFNSETLIPSYSLFAHYEGDEANLYKHVDDNACTYTIDFCVYQTDPWDLYVSEKAYTLYPNQALAYYGNDQLHWREKFPNPDNQVVSMIFFHFVEPDHWWYTKGPGYLDVIRNNITEEEWEKRNNISL
jgi:hypothetical protein